VLTLGGGVLVSAKGADAGAVTARDDGPGWLKTTRVVGSVGKIATARTPCAAKLPAVKA